MNIDRIKSCDFIKSLRKEEREGRGKKVLKKVLTFKFHGFFNTEGYENIVRNIVFCFFKSFSRVISHLQNFGGLRSFFNFILYERYKLSGNKLKSQ